MQQLKPFSHVTNAHILRDAEIAKATTVNLAKGNVPTLMYIVYIPIYEMARLDNHMFCYLFCWEEHERTLVFENHNMYI